MSYPARSAREGLGDAWPIADAPYEGHLILRSVDPVKQRVQSDQSPSVLEVAQALLVAVSPSVLLSAKRSESSSQMPTNR